MYDFSLTTGCFGVKKQQCWRYMSKTSNALCCRDTVSTIYEKYKNGLYWLKSDLGQKSVIYKYILFNSEMCLFRNVNQWLLKFACSVYWTDPVYESRRQILIIWSWPQLMSAELRRRADHSTPIPLMWPLSSRPGLDLETKRKDESERCLRWQRPYTFTAGVLSDSVG